MLDLTFSLSDLEFFLLILMRVSTCVFVAPFFSLKGTPNQVKIGFSVLFSVMIYNTIPITPVEYHTVLGYALIVLKEAVTGLLIGYGAQIATTILRLAGHIADMETGLSMVTVFDPATNENVTITGSYYQYAVTLLLLISGMYQYVLAALRETYNLIPVNGAIFSSDKLLYSIGVFLADFMSIGFRICLPIFCVMLLLNSILGVLAKVSPQLNMFAVGIQFKILVGLSVLFLTVGMLPTVSGIILDEMKKMMTLFTEALI